MNEVNNYKEEIIKIVKEIDYLIKYFQLKTYKL